MIKAERCFISEGCFLLLIAAAISSAAQPHCAVSGQCPVEKTSLAGQESLQWLCLAEDIVELLLPDGGLSKGLQRRKGRGSRGSAQGGLKEVVGQGERKEKKGGNGCMKPQWVQTRLGELSEWRWGKRRLYWGESCHQIKERGVEGRCHVFN